MLHLMPMAPASEAYKIMIMCLNRKAAQPNSCRFYFASSLNMKPYVGWARGNPCAPFPDNLEAAGTSNPEVSEQQKPQLQICHLTLQAATFTENPGYNWTDRSLVLEASQQNLKRWGITDSCLCPCGQNTHPSLANAMWQNFSPLFLK